MPAITVSRQYAAGGSDIAALLGQRLGWTVIDNEFVELVSQRAGVPASEVERLQERVPGLLERLAQALALASPEVFVVTGETRVGGPTPEDEIVQVTETVINEAVKHSNVVLVGRGAQAHLAARDNVLHVFIVAPRDVRITRAMDRLKVDRKDAEKRVDEMDNARRHYVKERYRRVWDDPANYHLVVNTDRFSYDRAVELIAKAVEYSTRP
jgi:cytidylate kinase